jgi:hypothetical protein
MGQMVLWLLRDDAIVEVTCDYRKSSAAAVAGCLAWSWKQLPAAAPSMS